MAGLASRETIDLIRLRPWTSPGSCCGGLWWVGCLPWAAVRGGAPPTRSPGSSALPGAPCCALQALVGASVLGSSCHFHQGERFDRSTGSWAPRMEQGSPAAQGLVVSHGRVITQWFGKRARVPMARHLEAWRATGAGKDQGTSWASRTGGLRPWLVSTGTTPGWVPAALPILAGTADYRCQVSRGLRSPQPQSRFPIQGPRPEGNQALFSHLHPRTKLGWLSPPGGSSGLSGALGGSIGGAALAGDPRPCCGFSPSAPGVGLAPGPRAETHSCLEQRESCLYEAEQDRHILKAAVKQDLAL